MATAVAQWRDQNADSPALANMKRYSMVPGFASLPSAIRFCCRSFCHSQARARLGDRECAAKVSEVVLFRRVIRSDASPQTLTDHCAVQRQPRWRPPMQAAPSHDTRRPII